MSSTSPEPVSRPTGAVPQESLEDQARRKGVRPLGSVHESAREGIWETEEELDDFLRHVRASRHAELG